MQTYFQMVAFYTAWGKDIWVTEKDGSNSRKVLSVDAVPVEPSVSPDGKRAVFTLWAPGRRPISIDEFRTDGSGLHVLLRNSAGEHLCCARWTSDGHYLVYENRHEGRTDLWVLSMQSGFLHRAPSPIQLTNGPLSYRKAVSSRDGKQIFAVGVEARGELVRYDANSKQFLPLLPGVPAFDPSWSADGKWVAYTAYPRSRVVAQPKRWDRCFATDLSPWTGVFPRYFSGRQTGRVRQFRGRDFPDRHGRSIAPDDGGEGRGLAPLVAGWEPAGVQGSRRFPPTSTYWISTPAGVLWYPDRQACGIHTGPATIGWSPPRGTPRS